MSKKSDLDKMYEFTRAKNRSSGGGGNFDRRQGCGFWCRTAAVSSPKRLSVVCQERSRVLIWVPCH